MTFRPIAVVGRACVLPGALSPEALWAAVLAGQDLTGPAPEGRWGLAPERVLAPDAPERAHHDRGGYVTGFEDVFDPTGFRVPAQDVQALDPLVQWTLHAAREAFRQASGSQLRAGAVLGNLSLPSESLTAYAERVWLDAQGATLLDGRAADAAGLPRPDPHNRFMSGYPALVLAQALGLEAGAFALDAACASSLYAVKLACDMLADGRADLMLAGAVNRADDLFLHMGFTALQALSPSGRSRPFHRGADGLLPAEGAAFLALKRLEDAIGDGDRILGVIRGVGLANDGRASGLLVPDSEGQERALRIAYAQAGWQPEAVGMVECHATGTPVGDATELATLSRVFTGCRDVPLGSIKGNLGHPITVAGLAGILKILGAFEAEVRPPNPPVDDPTPALRDTPFRLLQAAEPWPAGGAPRRAAISAFGFGGNDAHLLLEAWDPEVTAPPMPEPPAPPTGQIAVVGLGALVGDGQDAHDLAVGLFGEETPGRRATSLAWAPRQLRFPPADLKAALPQQLWILAAAEQALAGVTPPARERAGVFAGMQCDATIARYGVRWRVAEWLDAWTRAGLTGPFTDAWLAEARDAASPVLTAAGVIGTLPNIVANRLNSQFDFGGPGFAISAEELSGLAALRIACRALRAGELDLALVGAVDLADEAVQAAAARAVLPPDRHEPGDAAVAFTLKRLEDAVRDGDAVLAVLPDDDTVTPGWTLALAEGEGGLTARFGHAHAASGLLHVAAAVLACRHRARPRAIGAAEPVLAPRPEAVAVQVAGMAGARDAVVVQPAMGAAQPFLAAPPPGLFVYAGPDRASVRAALAAGDLGQDGPARLVIVATGAEELATKRAKAEAWLAADSGPLPPGEGIYFRDTPAGGEIAALFGGAASAYAGMGRGLMLALPELGEAVAQGFSGTAEAAAWIWGDDVAAPTPLQKLWGASVLAQAHAHLTRRVLGVPFSAAIGVSSGETNALYAFGAWTDMGALRQEFEAAEVFTRWLGGRCEVLKEAWSGMGLASYEWTTWRLAAPLEEVRRTVEAEPFVALTMILGARDVVIGGHPDACRRAIAALGPDAAVPLGYDVAVHAPEVKGYAEAWHALHRRPTAPVPGVRFYSHATGGAYEPTADAAADALLGQALKPIDFPALIEAAYADGVRVFIEHGPQGSLAPLVREILGDRPHVAVSLDLAGASPIRQLMQAVGQLVAAGVPVAWEALAERWAHAGPARPAADGPLMSFAGRRPELIFPLLPRLASAEATVAMLPQAAAGLQRMPQAPVLPPVLAELTPSPTALPSALAPEPGPAPPAAAVGQAGATGAAPVARPTPLASPARAASPPAASPPAGVASAAALPFAPLANPLPVLPLSTPPSVLPQVVEAQRQAHEAYMVLLAQQAQVHQQFLAQSAAALQAVVARTRGQQALSPAVAPMQQPPIDVTPILPAIAVTAPAVTAVAQAPVPAPAAPAPAPPAPAPAPPAPASAPPTPPAPIAHAVHTPPAGAAGGPVGPAFDRGQLEVLASGRISDVFGPLFRQQDGFERQVRMPEPPMLLADRVTGIKAEPGSMKTGTIWTETDVRWDSWWLHQGRMPAGIMVESGQADLLLISWLGADFLNQGERVYRLLGCQLTYHAEPKTGYEVLPKPGETLKYDIHVDGHARQGDIRLFFFHYDCRIDGAPRLTVRHGQAGFFTDEELASSGGVLWDPLEAMPEGGRVDPARCLTTRRAFSGADIEAFAEGRMADAFGPGFEPARSHVRSPRMSGEAMRFFDEVTDFDPQGGPWGRGYLRATARVTPDDWYFRGHFKNDPCMPGTLMFEGTLQTMAIYLAALGFAIDKDGWRFEPVPEVPYHMRCRGQVRPDSRELVYEVFVEEVHDGANPTLWADLLVTVDGLKAFHCRKMGVRLVPGFPMEERPELMAAADPVPVAAEDGFAFGQQSLWACAWGRPSMAFGPKFAGFDAGKRLPRLPGPPYHFMSRVVQIDGKIGEARVGSAIVAEYDVPPDAWYFAENGNRTMPYAVLLEAALQPCGWLASFIGVPLRSEGELFFRNLDGTSTQHLEVMPDAGTIRTGVKLTKMANAGGMVIVGFEVRCTLDGAPLYDMDTVFGFFPGAALASQVGIPPTPEEAAAVAAPCDFLVDIAAEPARYAEPAIAPAMLRLIDRVTGWWPEGGPAGLGRARAEKDVDPGNWYFKAHFFQDPVQPGSLGIEALIQLLQAAMIEKGLAARVPNPRFEAIGIGMPMTWKYRGQVVPTARTVVVELDLTEVGRDERGVYAKADGWLWVDGMRIYGATGMGMRILAGDGPPAGDDAPSSALRAPSPLPASPPGPDEEILDPEIDTWLQDHKPTYVIPVLPFMSLLDRLAAAAQAARPDERVVGLADVHVQKWVALPGGPLRLRRRATARPDGRLDVAIERWWDAPNPALSRFEPVATAVAATAAAWPAAPAAWEAPGDATLQPDPYAAGDMFHGPAFHVLRKLAIGGSGASAELDAATTVPPGLLNQVLLDGVTHAIPGTELQRWSPEIADDQVGYPSRIPTLTLHGPAPLAGPVRCEVRFAGFHGGPRFPKFEVQLIAGGAVWATLELVYILFPKGPLGTAPGPVRQAFLAERVAVPHLGLTRGDGSATRLTPREVRGSDWLPGTLARIYRAEGDLEALTRQIAVKEHVARRLAVHPGDVKLVHDGLSAIAPGAPLTRHDIELTVAPDGEVAVSDAGTSLDVTPVRTYWRERLGMGPWPGEDLYYGLAERYVESVRLEDAEAFALTRGRGVLYLANHQVGIESLLFSLIASALGGVPTATLAKTEHRDSWLGRLIAHHFAYPGVADPELILFFDRQDPASLPGILTSLKPLMARGEKSLMVHADGTRSVAANKPVQQVTAALIDLALEAGVPIVPVRFAGGLPLEAAAERLEFPVGHGKQTYWIGRPIWPDDLRPMGLAERKKAILDALANLGPAAGAERPAPPQDGFAAEVAGWRARAKVAEIPAVMFKTLEHVKEPTPETRALLAVVRRARGTGPLEAVPPGNWFRTLADWLTGRTETLAPPTAGSDADG